MRYHSSSVILSQKAPYIRGNYRGKGFLYSFSARLYGKGIHFGNRKNAVWQRVINCNGSCGGLVQHDILC